MLASPSNSGVTSSSNEVQITDEDIWRISETISQGEHRSLARLLGLTEQSILDIETNKAIHHHDYQEIPYQILMKWRQMNGKSATIGILNDVLLKIRNKDSLSSFTGRVFTRIKDAVKRAPLRGSANFRLKDLQRNIADKQKIRFKHLNLPRSLWLEKKVLDLHELFVELTMINKNKRGKETSKLIQLEDIFVKRDSDTLPRILIEGHPGFGKTTLLMKLLSDWSREKEYVSSVFQLTFVIPLRSFKKTLTAHLHQQCQGLTKTEEETMEVIESIENKVLLLLDGWDEATEETKRTLLPLLQGTIHPKMTIVVTCRTGHYLLQREGFDDDLNILGVGGSNNYLFWEKRIQIKGVSEKKRKEFLRKYLKLSSEELEERLRESSVLIDEFYQCPLFLIIMAVFLHEKKREVVKTKTDLYKAIFNFVVQRNLVRENLIDKNKDFNLFISKNSNSCRYRNILIDFGRLCLEKLKSQDLTFDDRDLSNYSNEHYNVIKLGFLSKNIAFSFYEESELYEPIHRSILEFSAAFYLSTLGENLMKDEVKGLFQVKIRPTKDQLLYTFLGGLLRSELNRLLKALYPWKRIICLFNTGCDESLYSMEHILLELLPTDIQFDCLEPFLPSQIHFDNEYNAPSTEFLSKWITPLMEYFGQNFCHEEIKLKTRCVNAINFLRFIPKRFIINRLILVTEKMIDNRIENTLKCNTLLIEDSNGFLLNSPLLLKELLLKFKSEKTCLKFNYSLIKNNTTTAKFSAFFRELSTGILNHLNVYSLELTNIDKDVFLSINHYVENLISTKRIQYHLGLSFVKNNAEDNEYSEINLGNFFFIVCNSHLPSFSSDLKNIAAPFEIQLNILNTTKKNWEYFKLTGKLWKLRRVEKLQPFEVENFDCIGFSSEKDELQSVLWKCKNLKKLSCDNDRVIDKVARLQGFFFKWEGFKTIEKLEFEEVLISNHFLSTISRFNNLKELEIKSLKCENVSHGITVLLRMVSSLPRLRKLIFNADDQLILTGFLKELSKSTKTQKKKIRLQELILGSFYLDPLSSANYVECLEEYLIYRYHRLLEEMVKKQREDYCINNFPQEETVGTENLLLKNKVYISQTLVDKTHTDKVIDLEMLFDITDDELPRRIWIEGLPMIGRTTLCEKLVNDWLSDSHYIASKFKLVFHINLKSFHSHESLSEYFVKQFEGEELSANDVIRCINKHQRHVLLILDNYDAMTEEDDRRKLFPLLVREQYPNISVLMTSRSRRIQGEYISELFNKRIEIKGIKEGEIGSFLTCCLNQICPSEAQNIKNAIRRVGIEDQCRFPWFLNLISQLVISTNNEMFNTKTSVFKGLFNFMVKRLLIAEGKLKDRSEVDLFNHSRKKSNKYNFFPTLRRFGQFSFECLLRNSVAFVVKKFLLNNEEDEMFLKLEFLMETTRFVSDKNEVMYESIHVSLLEFLAAFHLVNQFNDSKDAEGLKEEIRRIVNERGLLPIRDSLFFVFLGGLLNTNVNILFEALLPLSKMFHLGGTGFNNVLFEIQIADILSHSLRLLFPSFILSSLDKDSSLNSLFLSYDLKARNPIQIFFLWDLTSSIEFYNDVQIDHLLVHLTPKGLVKEFTNKLSLPNYKVLSLRLSNELEIKHWPNIINFLHLMKTDQFNFVIDQTNDNDMNTRLMFFLHQELICGQWKETKTIDRLKIRINRNDDLTKCFQLLIDLVKKEKLQGGIYLDVNYSFIKEEIYLEKVQGCLADFFYLVIQKNTIKHFHIFDHFGNSNSPVLDLNRFNEGHVIRMKSLCLEHNFTVLNRNLNKITIEEATILPYVNEEVDLHLIQQMEGVNYLCCKSECFNMLIKNSYCAFNKIKELHLKDVLSSRQDSFLLSTRSISQLLYLEVLTVTFPNEDIALSSELKNGFIQLFSCLNLRIVEMLNIRNNVQLFESIIECVIIGCEGERKKKRLESRVKKSHLYGEQTFLLQELFIDCDYQLLVAFTSPVNRSGKGIERIYKMLSTKHLKQCSWGPYVYHKAQEPFSLLFPFRDGFRISTEIDGMDPQSSHRSQTNYRWFKTQFKYSITFIS